MTLEKVTVIIPAYNEELRIRRAIGSVLAQNYTQWQMIVIDDGSTDQTAAKVLSYQDPRIRLLRQPNLGVSVARNNGIAAATTSWVAFLDADDEYLPAFLSSTMDTVSRLPDVVAVFSNGFIQQGEMRRAIIPGLSGEPFIIDDYCQFFLEHRVGIDSSRVVVARSVLADAGGFPIGKSNWEDIDTWARISWLGKTVCIPTPLSIRHQVRGSASDVGRMAPIAYAQPWDAYLQWKLEGRLPGHLTASAEQYASYFLFWYLMAWIRARSPHMARKYLQRHALNLNFPTSRRLLIRILTSLPGALGSYAWDAIMWLRAIMRRAGYSARLASPKTARSKSRYLQ